MQRWVLIPRPWRVFNGTFRRCFSSQAVVQHITVPCASSGSITVSLHNVSESDRQSTTPLLIWVPPVSPCTKYGLQPRGVLPSWLRRYPTAVIHYRWPRLSSAPAKQTSPATTGDSENLDRRGEADSGVLSPLCWPVPIHDVLSGYSWIIENLAPASLARRDVYVCGSYLGAGLAAALALTESHAHQPMAIRGLIAYNGIFDWTTFLPDHPNNRSLLVPQNSKGFGSFQQFKDLLPALFRSPADLFDPFASPCLFFHSAPLLVPPDFDQGLLPPPSTPPRRNKSAGLLDLSSMSKAIDKLSQTAISPTDATDDPLAKLAGANAEMPSAPVLKAPRKGYLAFPPRWSTLKIPETLLLYENPLSSDADCLATGPKTVKSPKTKLRARRENSFEHQAAELATSMWRSVDKIELKERRKWDDQFEDWDTEAEMRVQLAEVNAMDASKRPLDSINDSDAGVSQEGQEVVTEWLQKRMRMTDL
ncbi:hypothetical protein QBC46DRAFT_388732 [Diplogelasinospora grovesii]|uniref:Alpha/beta hydrolase fold-3 domain-containing protein n=1 Tax=Diplogelasinospora grovesii TaxID=303347 RepID=A0AAN6N4K1_9PEZI|nr:hypothetical protein QBC46DRAFT_388732 [Diplogelasinospora grovesii]